MVVGSIFLFELCDWQLFYISCVVPVTLIFPLPAVIYVFLNIVGRSFTPKRRFFYISIFSTNMRFGAKDGCFATWPRVCPPLPPPGAYFAGALFPPPGNLGLLPF